MYDKEFLAGNEGVEPEQTQSSAKAQPEFEAGDERSIAWEVNHKKIIAAINKVMVAYRGQPPSVSEIARMTDLSRQTIYTHLHEYARHPAYRESTEMFGLMKFDIMMRLRSTALDGDMRAIKLYLQLTGMLDKKANT